MINREKTTLFFNRNIEAQTQDAIKEALSVPTIQHYEKYLGLPSFIGREKKACFTNVKEQIWGRMQGLKEKLLSSWKGGHDQGSHSINSYLLDECF